MRRQRGDDRVYNIGKKKACRGVPVIQSRARALQVIEWPGARLAHKYIFTSGERVDHWKAYSPGRLGGISLMSDTEITLSPHIYTVNTLVYPSLSSSLTNRGREHKRVERLRERLDNGRIMAKLWELESPRGIPGEKFSAAFAPFFRALRWPDGAYSDEILRGFAWNCAPGKWNFRGAPRMLGQQSSSILVLHNTAGHFSSSSILLLFFFVIPQRGKSWTKLCVVISENRIVLQLSQTVLCTYMLYVNVMQHVYYVKVTQKHTLCSKFGKAVGKK